MGIIHADVELINTGDVVMVHHNLMDSGDVKQVCANMLVDSGSIYMCINERIREQLGLLIVGKRRPRLANEDCCEYDVAGPIEMKFGNRRCYTNAIVLPGDSEPLLGAIPMEDMDVLIDAKRQ